MQSIAKNLQLKVMYPTALELLDHHEPMGKWAVGVDNIVFYISEAIFGPVWPRSASGIVPGSLALICQFGAVWAECTLYLPLE